VWLIVDTNQARNIPPTLRGGRVTARARGLVLPPYLLAEVLQRGPVPRRETLTALTRYPVRIGLEPSVVFQAVARLAPNQIRRFEPFPADGSVTAERYAELLREVGPMVSGPALAWARDVIADSRRFAERLTRQAMVAREQFRASNVGRVSTFDELRPMMNGVNSFVGALVVSALSDHRGDQAPNLDRVYLAVMRNSYLAHLFKALLYYLISVSRLWRNQRLNRDVGQSDWVDLTMTLYVGTRDVLISRDRLLARIFDAVDPTIRLRTATDL
jgi:hypothetical protein